MSEAQAECCEDWESFKSWMGDHEKRFEKCNILSMIMAAPTG